MGSVESSVVMHQKVVYEVIYFYNMKYKQRDDEMCNSEDNLRNGVLWKFHGCTNHNSPGRQQITFLLVRQPLYKWIVFLVGGTRNPI